MSQAFPDYVTPLISLLAVIVAAVALVFAVVSERRAGRRFEEGLRLQERLGIASVRPYLVIRGVRAEDSIRLLLRNAGLGVAIVTSLRFQLGNREASDIITLLDMPALWVDAAFSADRTSLAPNDEIELFRLTKLYLHDQGLTQRTINEQFQSFQRGLVGVTLRIVYEDVLGNGQPFNPVALQEPLQLSG
jgi:hypothetical protein